MSVEPVRIGGASGFWGDSQLAVPQLMVAGVQFMVFDYLAELTMSILAAARAKQPAKGYATDFVAQVGPHLPELMRRGVRLVSNAGGVNPSACAEAIGQAAAALGLSPSIAVVEGDDVMQLQDAVRSEQVRDWQGGQPLPPRLVTANAYLGALPIRKALDLGADIVITGRCVDSAVTLGVLMHAFRWAEDDHDKLAMGSLAGHLIECGCQATGGLFTDWQAVPDWPRIGYPIVEAHADGRFAITKPEGTGGLVCVPALAEQMLYEIGDPALYVLPDVICDFTQVRMVQQSADCVLVEGARGSPPTDTYKVCATYPDGYRATAQVTIVGFDAEAKARRTAEALLERTRALFRERGHADYSDTLVEVLGTLGAFEAQAPGRRVQEVVLRLAVAHADKRALDLFAREIAPAGTSWAPGTTGISGRPAPAPVLKLFSFLLAKSRLQPTVTFQGERHSIDVPAGVPSAPRVSGGPQAVAEAEPDPSAEELVMVPLIEAAYARSGDKGDSCNVGVIARSAGLLPHLRREVTVQRVRDHLAPLVQGAVTRHELPGIGAMNFVLEQALGGGGMASLRNDPWGKGMAQLLLALPVRVPRRLLAA
jgi:hypothetical protein